MQLVEKEFLVNEKETNGLDSSRAWKEVNDLIKAEKTFKILWNEKKSLERDYNKLLRDNEKLKSSIFKLKFEIEKNKKECKEIQPKIYSGSLFQLRRIINFMEKDKIYSKRKLSEELCMNTPELNSCLDFLYQFNIINLELKKDGIMRR